MVPVNICTCREGMWWVAPLLFIPAPRREKKCDYRTVILYPGACETQGETVPVSACVCETDSQTLLLSTDVFPRNFGKYLLLQILMRKWHL